MHVPSQVTKCKWFSKMKEELDVFLVSIEPLNCLDIIRSTKAATCMSLNLREIWVKVLNTLTHISLKFKLYRSSKICGRQPLKNMK